MSIAFLLAVYFVVWWVTLFAVLPFGVRTQAEAGEVVPGTPESAPADFPFWRIMLATTVVSAIVFAALWFAVKSGIIDLGLVARPQ